MFRPLKIVIRGLCWMLLASLTGCASQTDDFSLTGSEPIQPQQPVSSMASLPATDGSPEEPDCDDALEAGLPVAHPPSQSVLGPYPERENPFEFSIDVATDGPLAGGQTADVKLFGFVGQEHPRAIIHSGNETRVMSEGDSWGVLEIMDIQPPQVRIRTDGVVRTWSLLDR